MLTLNTELQYKKSQYESLYSMRMTKFLSAKFPVDQAFVCHVDDDADCTAVSPLTGAGAVHTGRKDATKCLPDTSHPRHFGAPVPKCRRQFGTGAEVPGHFGSKTFRHRDSLVLMPRQFGPYRSGHFRPWVRTFRH